LFSRKEWHQAEREKFEELTGWRYGLVFGVTLILVGWGWDAYELWRASSDIFWYKLALVAITLVPLTLCAGSMAGRSHKSIFFKFVVWFLAGGALGVIGLAMSFEGVSALAAWLDSSIRGISIYQFSPALAERVPLIVLFGACVGVAVAALQILATSWAWDNSSADYRFTHANWRLLFLCAPAALLLGALYDGSINSQVRAPVQISHRIIQIALTLSPDLDIHTLDTATMLDYVSVAKWRGNFTPQYTQHIADLDPRKLTWAYVDAEFDNGFIWRCQSVRNGDGLVDCIDLQAQYWDWMQQFIRTGIVQCKDCLVTITPPVQIWHTQNAKNLGEPQQIVLTHHTGGVIVMTATLPGGQIDCRFVGANPVAIRDCVQR
jgi:hypothetical protein